MFSRLGAESDTEADKLTTEGTGQVMHAGISDLLCVVPVMSEPVAAGMEVTTHQ